MKSIFLFFLIQIFLNSTELKKEIFIPFPNSVNIEKEESLTKEPSTEKKTSIKIQFPNDELKEKNTEVIQFNELNKDRNIPPKNELPLQKILILPEQKNQEENKTIEDKNKPKEESKTNLTDESKTAKPDDKKILVKEAKDSNLKKALTENKPKDIRSNSKLFLNKEDEILSKKDSPRVSLPNQTSKSKSKTSKEDESIPPYERSKYQINRDNIPEANPDLSLSSNSNGIKSNPAKFDQIRLLSIDRKKSEALSIVDSIEDIENKMKAYYELAIGLENSSKSNKKLMAESIPYLLKIITEAPKDSPILPKSLWAISQLHYKIDEQTQSLDHLSNLILNHKNSEFIDDAVYLSARIYEEVPSVRNLDRAKKYYSMFLKNLDKTNFKNSIYLPFVKSRSEKYSLD
jgi:hypothetical protein